MPQVKVEIERIKVKTMNMEVQLMILCHIFRPEDQIEPQIIHDPVHSFDKTAQSLNTPDESLCSRLIEKQADFI